MDDLWPAIEKQIQQHNPHFQLQSQTSVSGGCINRCHQLLSKQKQYFLKLNHANQAAMFSAEAAGLTELHRSQSLRTPQPLCSGVIGEQSFLVMEWIEFDHRSGNQRRLAEQLVQLHQQSRPHFGWSQNNTIGATPQKNRQQSSWLTFWREQRLGFQLRLAAKNGHRGQLQELGNKLLESLDQLLDHQPQASLLHGDLWGGNVAYAQGEPVIFDPAIYYGDRETDLAMTELFGGFSADFYAAYQHHWPLDSGYQVRKILYNLYHILNHLNLFGEGYRSQAEAMMQRLLAEVRG